MDGVLADQGSPTGTPPEQTSLSPVSVSHTAENAKPLMNGAAVEEAEIELVPTAGSEKMEPVAIENWVTATKGTVVSMEIKDVRGGTKFFWNNHWSG